MTVRIPIRASRLALVATGPVVLAQGRAVRRTTPVLPEADGPTIVRADHETGDDEARDDARRVPLRLLVLGDSTVAGIGVDRHDDGLAGGLAREFAARCGRSVIATAIGRGGATARDLVTDLLAPAVAAGPWDAVVLSIGANDALAARSRRAVVRDVLAVIRGLEAGSPGIEVLLSSLPGFRFFDLLPQPLRWNLDLHARSIEAALRTAVADRGLGWMTPPATGYTDDFFAADRFHPGAVGYARWSAWIADAADTAGVLDRMRR